jgi:regulatory protein YycH of two-component signal transduction system YycFG
MWFVKNKNVTMLHNLLRNWPVMMEASSLHVTWIKKSFYLPQEKNEVDDVNKASETFSSLKWVWPTTVPVMSSI